MDKLLDSTISLLILVVLLPLFLIVGIMIKLTSKGPVFFTQMRIGRNNELFKFYKFRTMKIGTPDVSTDKLDSSKSYVTLIGKFLRKSSLDELPQSINILKGDMTFVGPRLALYNQYELKKTVHDVYYLNNKSLALDVKILFRTVFKVIKAEGINDDGLKTRRSKDYSA
ncbi:sugar transferase [Clostridium sp.]|uniref:sugar transferase n=1 Tax=Clostridium sp. TaxID=1506 RepID=UPI003D6D9712